MEDKYRSLRSRGVQLFTLADADKNGWLSKNELKKVLQKDHQLRWELRTAGGRTWADFWAELDSNDDGKIQLEELIAYMVKIVEEIGGTQRDSLKSRAKQIFDEADLDKNGWLSRNELKKALHKDPDLRDELVASHGRHWADFWAELDVDGDSKITLEELTDYIEKHHSDHVTKSIVIVNEGAEKGPAKVEGAAVQEGSAKTVGGEGAGEVVSGEGEAVVTSEGSAEGDEVSGEATLSFSLWTDGLASLAERIAALRKASVVLFERADRNGDGELSKNELKRVIQQDNKLRFAMRMSGGRHWFNFWEVMDENDDGTVQQGELSDYIVKMEFDRVAGLIDGVIGLAKAIADAGEKEGQSVKAQLQEDCDISDDLRSGFGNSWATFFDGVADDGVTAALLEDYIKKTHQSAVDECQ